MMAKLTPEQEAFISVYRHKWRKITLSTERIDRQKAEAAVKAIYAVIDYETPKIIFADSPYAACNLMLNRLSPQFIENSANEPSGIGLLFSAHLYLEILRKLTQQLSQQAIIRLHKSFYSGINPQFYHVIFNNLINKLSNLEDEQVTDYSRWIKIQLGECFIPEFYVHWLTGFDFFISVLNLVDPPKEWQVFQFLIKECGWLFAYDDICIICDRPLQIRFDNQNRLHAEGEPAIEYVDGYKLYSYHGVTLPEKYGKLHPQQWRSQWLLTEENAELRRVLIQGIGYSRICQELQAIELDTWKEYTLLKIDADVDQQPIYLLKMTCPSTGFIHALRVPADMTSAYQAICWVNWGIAPEEFAIQT
ncbi:hypothetical protein H6G41_06050 [Tolypothrix sp. FACHB-123]|uniref:DUF6745 domain-containing protein n=1 Tax=Tolypothrix sp. FACHB-123 TaxID=2692868 RepID=UPI0016824367|nr:hypothetical protein [Tolypothrix sp. FACHB-123]MBD2354190.1 hypothetical protein [Tolypothrix sp. FACHB-123]